MKGDFTRMTFNPQKHFSRVLMQQGRVQLDADWNEQIEITTHRVETESVDAIGGCGAPIHAPAFGLVTDPTTLPADEQQRLTDLGWLPLAAGDFILSAGRFYVDGILVENEHPVPYTRQPDLPGLSPLAAGEYLAYLDVWQRHLTALEEPEIREVALGGPDTATRAHIVWQVRVISVEGGTNCLTSLTGWDALLAGSTGQLSARAHPDETSNDPCIVPPTAGFRGLQNQLYRVEIHDPGGLNGATFKWSRDNGSLVFAIDEFIAGHPEQVRVRSLGRDQELGLHKGDWVEVLDDDSELTFTPGTMAQIDDIDEDELVLTLSVNIAGYDLARHAKVRRWDAELQTVQRPAGNDHFIPLENGVEIMFEAGAYHTGDYWLIPARTILGNPTLTQTGGIEWPVDGSGNALPQPAAGIQHQYCRLAVIGYDGTTFTIEDCRPFFPPATELIEMFYLGGDGQVAFPGKKLPQPLEAGVSLGQWPVEGARVRFHILEGSGTLTGGGSSGSDIVVETLATGVASVTWQLDETTSSQQVQVTLEDVAADDLHLPIHYNASLGFELYPVGGDGQEAMPGDDLPKPLEVRLTDGHWPVSKEHIIFELAEPGSGTLTGGGSSGTQVDVVTDDDGYAACNWKLGGLPAKPALTVRAYWAGEETLPQHRPVHFNAGLSIASEVAYHTSCEGLAQADNVQDALDLLCRNAALYYVGGDGQEGTPGQVLPKPLEVRLANGAWPVSEATVIFRLGTPGDGQLTAPDGTTSNTEVDITTDGNGLASASWTLGKQDSQQVVAFWKDKPDLEVHFNANLDTGRGAPQDPAIHIVEVVLNTGKPLVHDGIVPVADLLEGFRIVCDQELDPDAVNGKPVCVVTLDLPYPFNQADMTLWDIGEVFAFQPLILDARVSLEAVSILWTPTQPVRQWLEQRLFQRMQERKRGDMVLVHVELKGNFVWDAKERKIYVDGEAFGVPAGGTPSNLILPSGNRIRGGDFEMWFHLVHG